MTNKTTLGREMQTKKQRDKTCLREALHESENGHKTWEWDLKQVDEFRWVAALIDVDNYDDSGFEGLMMFGVF